MLRASFKQACLHETLFFHAFCVQFRCTMPNDWRHTDECSEHCSMKSAIACETRPKGFRGHRLICAHLCRYGKNRGSIGIFCCIIGRCNSTSMTGCFELKAKC